MEATMIRLCKERPVRIVDIASKAGTVQRDQGPRILDVMRAMKLTYIERLLVYLAFQSNTIQAILFNIYWQSIQSGY